MMKTAARTLLIVVSITVMAGLLSACASGPWRRLLQQQATTEAQPTATPEMIRPTAILANPTEPAATEIPTAAATITPTQPPATIVPTVVVDTAGANLESQLDALNGANADADPLNDIN
jgi:hypothetical protein